MNDFAGIFIAQFFLTGSFLTARAIMTTNNSSLINNQQDLTIGIATVHIVTGYTQHL
jgi:hypothetical protein